MHFGNKHRKIQLTIGISMRNCHYCLLICSTMHALTASIIFNALHRSDQEEYVPFRELLYLLSESLDHRWDIHQNFEPINWKWINPEGNSGGM